MLRAARFRIALHSFSKCLQDAHVGMLSGAPTFLAVGKARSKRPVLDLRKAPNDPEELKKAAAPMLPCFCGFRV